MRDILERLQGPRTPQGGSWPYPNLHDEAADEIKILRGQVEALDNERSWLWTEKLRMQLEITRLREENARMRRMVKTVYAEGCYDSTKTEKTQEEFEALWKESFAYNGILEGGKS